MFARTIKKSKRILALLMSICIFNMNLFSYGQILDDIVNLTSESISTTGAESTETESTGTEGTGTESTETESTGTESTETESTETEGTETEGTGTESTETEGTELESTETESTGTEGTGTESTETESTGTESTETEGTETEGTGTESTETEGTELESTETESTETESTETESTGTEGTETEGTGTESTETEGTELESTETESTETESTETESTGTEGTETEGTGTESTETSYGRPAMSFMATSPASTRNTKPVITVNDITSDNANSSFAQLGDTVSLSITTSIEVENVYVVIDDNFDDVVVIGSGTEWLASLVLTDSNNEGLIGFSVDAETSDGTMADTVSNTVDESFVMFDKTAPVVNSIGSVILGNIGTNEATVKMSINDAVSGVSKIEVSTNGGTSYTDANVIGFTSGKVGIQNDITFIFSQTGTYNVRFTDVAGNISTDTEVVINDSAVKSEILTLPTKTEYIQGDTLDLTGGTIKYGTTFTAGTEVSMKDSNVSVTGFDSSKAGQATLVVSYQETYVNFTVNIEAGQKYFTFGTNGSDLAVKIASTSVTAEGLNDLEYLWSYSDTEIGTKTYVPDTTYTGNGTFIFNGKKFEYDSVTQALLSTDSTSTWYYEDKTDGIIQGKIFRSPSYSKVPGVDQIARETILISTDYPDEMGTLSFDYYVSSQERYHTLDVWVNGIKVVKGMSGNTGWLNYTGKHQMNGGSIEVVLEYKVSGGISISGDNMAAIKNLEFTGNNVWKGFANGASLTSPILGPETYLHVRGNLNGQKVTEVSDVFIGNVSLEGIKMDMVPYQTVYELDESINLYGGKITLIYDCGEQQIDITTPGVSISNFDSTSYGVNKVYVSYEGFSTYYYVTINTTSHPSNLVNEPDLDPGMVPVKWVEGEGWMVTTEDDIGWYDYSSSEKRWANVMLKDNLLVREVPDAEAATINEMAGKMVISEGSLYVWIPRYTYSVVNGTTGIKSVTDTSGTGTVKTMIKWSNGTTDDTSGGYYSHPAFFYGSYNGGNPNSSSSYSTGSKLTGFWIAKFEASNNEGNISISADSNAWTNISIDDAFDFSQSISTDNASYYGLTGSATTSHLIKNSEWGAVAMLTNGYSYEEDDFIGDLPFINNYNIGGPKTGYAASTQNRVPTTTVSNIGNTTYVWNSTKGLNASSTGNIYGVYDFSGGVSEMVASYINNGFEDLNINGTSLTDSVNVSDVDVISGLTIDDFILETYDALENYYGFAINEFSRGVDEENGAMMVDSDGGMLPFMDLPFFARGGNYSLEANAGAFAVEPIYGDDSDSKTGFRPTIVMAGTNSSADVEIKDITIYSDNALPNIAKIGDTVTIEIEATDSIVVKKVIIQGNEAEVSGGARFWEASYVLTGSEQEGKITFSIDYSISGVTQSSETDTTDGSRVTFYKNIEEDDVTVTPEVKPDGSGVDVTVDIGDGPGGGSGTGSNPIVVKKWLPGSHTVEDFQDAGNEFTGKFTVDENGRYTIYIKDQAGNEYVEEIEITGIDKTPLEVVFVTLKSNNENQNFAKKGNIITLDFEFNKEIQNPQISILSRIIPASKISTTDNINWTATYTTTASDIEGLVPFKISGYTDALGNEGEDITETTDGSEVIYDRTFVDITLSQPSETITTGKEVTYIASFTDEYLVESTIDLLNTDIELITTGSVNADIDVNKTFSSNEREIKIKNISGEGTIGIKINGATSTNEDPIHYIAKDMAGNPAALVTSSTFIVDTLPPEITLEKTPEEMTDGPVTIIVNSDDMDQITDLKWLPGNKTVEDFATEGTDIVDGNFDVTENGTYTVYAKDQYGNEIIKTIEINNKGFCVAITNNIEGAGTTIGSGIYVVNAPVTIEANPYEGYRFGYWTTPDVSIEVESSPTSFYMPEKTVNIVANFIKQWTVTFVDDDGTILKTEVVDEGGSATPPADPEKEGWVFDGWDTDYSNITGDTIVTAQYVNNTYTVTLVSNIEGAGVLRGADSYAAGKTVTIEATANSGYEFEKWYSDDIIIAGNTNTSTTFEMPKQDVTITANFSQSEFEVIIEQNYPDGGTVIGAGNYLTGEEVVVNTTINNGYRFDKWTSSDVGINNPTQTEASFTMPKKGVTITANYVKQWTVTFEDEDGNIIKQEIVDNGGSATAPTAPEKEGYLFDGWDTEFDNVTEDITVRPQYVNNTYTVTLVSNIEGAGVLRGAGTYVAGRTVTIEAVANSEYKFETWYSDDIIIAGNTSTSTTFEMPKQDVIITANFAQSTFEVILSVNPESTGTVVGAGIYLVNSPVTIEANAYEGYRFGYWTTSDIIIESDKSPTSFYMPEQDVNIVANFIKQWTVTFVDDEGNVIKQEIVDNGGSATPPVGPEKEGWLFDGWDTEIDNITEDTIVRPEYKNNTFTVTLISNIEGAGTFEGAGSYVAGKTVAIGATPNSGYEFVSWTSDSMVVPNSTSPTTTFEMPAKDITIQGNFILDEFAVTIIQNLPSAGEVSGSGTYESGEEVVVSTTLNSGYRFDGWTSLDVGISNPTQKIASFTMPKKVVTINANYTKQWTVTFVDDEGKVLKTEIVDDGSAATAPADPTKDGYLFGGWDTAFNKVESDLTVTAIFTQNINDINVTIEPEGAGEVTGAGSYCEGAIVTVKATAKPGYKFNGWSSTNFALNNTSNETVIIQMPGHDVDLVANFVKQSYSVTITSNMDGAGVLSGAGIYDESDEVTVSVNVSEGYIFKGWTTGDVELTDPTNTTVTFSMPANNVGIIANFEKQPYKVTILKNLNEAGEVTGEGDYVAEKFVSIGAIVNEGYRFVNWTSPDVSILSPTNVSSVFVMADKPVTITANFIKQWTVTFVDHDGTVLKTQIVDEGSNATAPNNPSRIGYTFKEWDTSYKNVTSDLTITAVYVRNSYSVKAYVSYEGTADGTLSTTYAENSYTLNKSNLSQKILVDEDDSISYEITLLNGTVADVSVNGTEMGTFTTSGETVHTFYDVDDNCEIRVKFRKIIVTANVTYEDNDVDGYVTVTNNGTTTKLNKTNRTVELEVEYGSERVFSIVPSGDYIAEVSVDGIPYGTSTSYMLSNIDKDHLVNIYFKEKVVGGMMSLITFNPSTGETVDNQFTTKIIGTGVDEETLQYITSISASNPTIFQADYISNEVYSYSGDWVASEEMLGSDTESVIVYRSNPEVATIDDSMALIQITTHESQQLNFQYIIDASSNSYFGIRINGEQIVDNISGSSGWQTFNQLVEPIDQKITIGMSYSKGDTAGGNDLAAIKGLRIGTQEWQPVENYAKLTLEALGANTYVIGKADSIFGEEITGVSGAFTTEIDIPEIYTIKAMTSTGGTISSKGVTKVTEGTSKTYTITPSSGYKVSNVIVDGVSQGAITSYTFSNISADHTISVVFVAN